MRPLRGPLTEGGAGLIADAMRTITTVPTLENQKHEAFARALAKGKSANESYVIAGYSKSRQNAHRLSSCDYIRQRVAELQTQAANTAETGERDLETGRFLPGNSGNGGRPKGSRNKLATEFIDAMYWDFQKNGAEAIKKVAAEKPAEYLRLIAQVLPKELDIALNVNSDLFAEAQDFHEAYQLAKRYIIGATDTRLIEAEADDVSEGEIAGD